MEGLSVLCSVYIIPVIVFYIVGYGLLNRKGIYDIFVQGVKEGFSIVYGIAPTIVGLLVAVGVIRNSGALLALGELMQPIGRALGIPVQIFPLIFVRLFSTSAANGLVVDLFKSYGTDSEIGLMASIMMSCTESAFYILSLYLLSIGVRKSRWALAGGLVATFAGVIASVVLAYAMG